MSNTLDGIRILDLTRILAGPYGSLLLADMGADVIKIENPSGGDPIRRMGPPFAEGESVYFLAVNRNKRSVALDLRSEEGREAFLRLVRNADVVFDNFRPGVTDRLGISSADCKSVNPSVITCSLSAFGADGPYRDLPAFDLIVQAMGGGMSITGEPGRPPARMGLPIGDLAGGMFAAQAICGALFRRERTGFAEDIELSLLDIQVSMLTYVAQYFVADGRVPEPIGSGHQTVVPYQAFRTADGWMVIAIFTDSRWPALCSALGIGEYAAEYPTNTDRLAAKDEVIATIQERLLTAPTDHWVSTLRQVGVPVGPVNTVDRVLTDPQVRHREMVTSASRPHPVAGDFEILGNPIKVGEPDRFEPAPLLGEHTRAVLTELAGLSGDEVRSLIDGGVAAQHERSAD